MRITFSVHRFQPERKAEPYFESFKVKFEEGMTVLDSLHEIQTKFDKSLAFRWECRSGICGTCGLMLNGKPILTCIEQINPKIKKQVIEPLANFPVERDLIVDLRLVLEKYRRIRPYLEQTKTVVVGKSEAEKSKPFRKCIECGCCIAGSKTVKKHPHDTLDPMALVKLARFLSDPRDSMDRKKIAAWEGVDKYSQAELKQLSKICPRDIPIDTALKLLKGSC